jgi:hypothetical protein
MCELGTISIHFLPKNSGTGNRVLILNVFIFSKQHNDRSVTSTYAVCKVRLITYAASCQAIPGGRFIYFRYIASGDHVKEFCIKGDLYLGCSLLRSQKLLLSARA